jgi:hypothetical protein
MGSLGTRDTERGRARIGMGTSLKVVGSALLPTDFSRRLDLTGVVVSPLISRRCLLLERRRLMGGDDDACCMNRGATGWGCGANRDTGCCPAAVTMF